MSGLVEGDETRGDGEQLSRGQKDGQLFYSRGRGFRNAHLGKAGDGKLQVEGGNVKLITQREFVSALRAPDETAQTVRLEDADQLVGEQVLPLRLAQWQVSVSAGADRDGRVSSLQNVRLA